MPLQLTVREDGLAVHGDGALAAVLRSAGVRLGASPTTQLTLRSAWRTAVAGKTAGEPADEATGEQTIALPDGARVHVRDHVAVLDDHSVGWHRCWWHEEERMLPGLELLAALDCPGALDAHLLPGLLYDGNPGAVTHRVVPRLGPGENLFEEHKFPSPFVAITTRLGDERWALSLAAEPCSTIDGHLPDQWWSLGLCTGQAMVTLLSTSGRLAINGQDEHAYVGQNTIAAYRGAVVDLRPRHRLEKRYRITIEHHPTTDAWRRPLRAAVAAQPPLSAPERAWLGREALEDAIRLKVGYALGRWIDDGAVAGMNRWPHRSEFARQERLIEYGWVGQNSLLGLSLWRWGRHCGDAALAERGSRAVAAWLAQARASVERGRPPRTLYYPDAAPGEHWCHTDRQPHAAVRPIAETLVDAARFCRRRRAAGEADLALEEDLGRVLDWAAAAGRLASHGLLPTAWSEDGQALPGPPTCAGALMVAALAEASHLPGRAHTQRTAQDLMERYRAAFIQQPGRHPCHTALDSGCEDLESGIFLLQAVQALGRTLAGRHEDHASLDAAAGWLIDWALTWTYTWDVPQRPGTVLHALTRSAPLSGGMSLQNRRVSNRAGAWSGFASRGWCDVSVQNRHLHVFSPAAAIATHAPDLGDQGRRMLAAILAMMARPDALLGMDEPGEHTEQYNHTTYIQQLGDPVCLPRGGIGRWFMPWMTSWVLSMCLDALEDGWSIEIPRAASP